jgi:hypothetical protein
MIHTDMIISTSKTTDDTVYLDVIFTRNLIKKIEIYIFILLISDKVF